MTVGSNENGQVVQARDSRGVYYYLADGLGEPTEGAWSSRLKAIDRLCGNGPEPEVRIDAKGNRMWEDDDEG